MLLLLLLLCSSEARYRGVSEADTGVVAAMGPEVTGVRN